MTEEERAPLVCSLTADERVDRGRWLGRVGRAARDSAYDGAGVTIRFRAGEGVEAELRELAAAEAKCCPFLTLEVRANGDELELRVEGPPDARPIIEEFCKQLV